MSVLIIQLLDSTGVMRVVLSDYDQIESRGLGSTPGVVYLLSKRLRNRNTDNSEISAEKAGQNCLVHNDPPTGGQQISLRLALEFACYPGAEITR